MGESSQHLHLVTKSINPVQYRLSGNDYLSNVILWISDNKITGIELTSKNGRHDSFGNKAKGRKFDFAIKDPEKPVFSYGRFRIFNNISEITKLGFEAVWLILYIFDSDVVNLIISILKFEEMERLLNKNKRKYSELQNYIQTSETSLTCIFTEAEEYPSFFKENLIDSDRTIKLFYQQPYAH